MSAIHYLSLCSGIEAATMAWHELGWKPVAFAEIEPFPAATLAHHYPDVPNLGDMTRWREWPKDMLQQVDVLVGGTPCQAFSVAGLRNSLADERGNLTLIYAHILQAIDDARARAGRPPAVCLWENVPGVLNTNDNALGCFLAALAGEDVPLLPPGGRWTNAGYVRGPDRAICWRVLDAQYFGVAQRRRRVFLVAGAGKGFRPEQVLFEQDGLRRDSAPSREARKGTAAGFECGPQGGGFTDIAPTLDTRCKDGPIRNQLGAGVMIPEVAECLQERDSKGADSDTKPGHLIPVSFRTSGNCGAWETGDRVDALTTGTDPNSHVVTHSLRGEGFDASEDGTGRGTPIVPVAFAENSRNEIRLEGGDGTRCGALSTGVATPAAVRRLTPTECERLQGFPDGHTLIPWRGKPADECPDGPRYKALGNSMAVPCMVFIGRRLNACLNSPITPTIP